MASYFGFLTLAQRGLDRVLPAPCLLCHRVSTPASASRLICSDCAAALPTLAPPHCPTCALPLTHPAPRCGQCLVRPPAFSEARIPFVYQHPLDGLIHQFKYRRQLASGKLLGELFLHALQATPLTQRPDYLVPVPMHWRRRWQRGFNQTDILARQLGNALCIPTLYACRQPLNTHSQKGLSRTARLHNLRRSFTTHPKVAPLLKHTHIALVDDVVTTTATARALSELLLAAGAQRVDIWALARTPEY